MDHKGPPMPLGEVQTFKAQKYFGGRFESRRHYCTTYCAPISNQSLQNVINDPISHLNNRKLTRLSCEVSSFGNSGKYIPGEIYNSFGETT